MSDCLAETRCELCGEIIWGGSPEPRCLPFCSPPVESENQRVLRKAVKGIAGEPKSTGRSAEERDARRAFNALCLEVDSGIVADVQDRVDAWVRAAEQAARHEVESTLQAIIEAVGLNPELDHSAEAIMAVARGQRDREWREGLKVKVWSGNDAAADPDTVRALFESGVKEAEKRGFEACRSMASKISATLANRSRGYMERNVALEIRGRINALRPEGGDDDTGA